MLRRLRTLSMLRRLRRRPRSISTPIIVGVVSVVLAIAMLVAWILVLVYSDLEADWLMVLGIISLTWIGLVLALFAVYLVRQILEVRRQVRFVDSVTHEIKSPLASLQMGLQTLARPQLSAEQRGTLRTMMLADVKRISAFVDDILTASRLGDGALVVQVAPAVALAELLRRSARRAAEQREVAVELIQVQVAEGHTVRGDPGALETVFVNLIDNALKYSDAPAVVRVQATVEGDRVEVAVTDQGIGLGDGERRRIFRRFYRADREVVRMRPGTGLGLFVVDGLVRSLGGRLRAESLGHGQGTTMWVSLPQGDPATGARP